MFNKMIATILPHMPKKLIWQFSKRYIAGENMEDALQVSRELNRQGIDVTIDLLGEFVTNLEQAEQNKNNYLEIIEQFTAQNINGNFSLKPSMFGIFRKKTLQFAKKNLFLETQNDKGDYTELINLKKYNLKFSTYPFTF